MSPLETVRVWTSCAQPELQRVEFWGSARHVHYRDNGLVRAVWPWPRSTVQFAMVKTKVGQWAMLERGARMHSGPHAKMESCMCDDESIMPPPQMSSRRRYDQYGQLGWCAEHHFQYPIKEEGMIGKLQRSSAGGWPHWLWPWTLIFLDWVKYTIQYLSKDTLVKSGFGPFDIMGAISEGTL